MANNLSNRADKCWISEALDNELPCREHSQHFSTIIYTRGEIQKPISGSNAEADGYLRGRIQAVPPEKTCSFDCPITDKEDHFANRLHVYDSFEYNDYMEHLMERLVDDADKIAGGVKELVSEALRTKDLDAFDAAIANLRVVDFPKAIEEAPLVSTRLLDNIPFSVDLFGGQNGPNAGAWTKRLNPDDPLLECQHIRHLMVREGDLLLYTTVANRVREAFSRIPRPHLGDIDHAALERYCRDRDAMFNIEWSLLSNLESLCLDLRGIEEARVKSVEPLLVKMGTHLRLKTLVLIGVPHLIDSNLVDSEEYVAQQEDNEDLVFPGDEHNPPTELTNYIHFLKECLCPGGELRLIVPNPLT